MKIDKNIADLICELEYKVGNQCYNPKSYNGWTGEEGCSFKYPVKYCITGKDLEKEELTKTNERIEYIEPECIGTMKYTFGANHLYIGDGIIEVMEYLEQRYNIDFNKLEENHVRTIKKQTEMNYQKVEKGGTVEVPSGRLKVGIDLKKGDYYVSAIEGKSCGTIYVYDEKGKNKKTVFVTEEEKKKICFKQDYIIKSYSGFRLCKRK